jgi:hypothetical protein
MIKQVEKSESKDLWPHRQNYVGIRRAEVPIFPVFFIFIFKYRFNLMLKFKSCCV